MTILIHAAHAARSASLGPVLRAVNGRATAWACSACGIVFSGDRHNILHEFATHLFKTRKQKIRRAARRTRTAAK